MLDTNHLPISESMQMYLVTIVRLWDGERPVPLSQLADVLSISAASVNEMCRKLQDNGLVQYKPYKGAVLTDEGLQRANYILRRHRLWEVFLVEKLGFDYQEAHDIACQLEHATPNQLADRLNVFLDSPAVNPEGEPIPAAGDVHDTRPVLLLDSLAAGQDAHIVQIDVEDTARVFLEQQGVRPGIRLHMLAVSPEGVLVRTNEADTVSLVRSLAGKIKVVLNMDDSQSELSVHVDSGLNANMGSEELMDMQQENQNFQAETGTEQISLDQLEVGQSGVIARVGGKGPIKQRMMDMGLVPGSEITVVRLAPLGDPVEFNVRGYNLSLRKVEAEKIKVEVNSQADGS